MRIFSGMVAILPALAWAAGGEVVGDVRLQVLSPTLIRVEVRGPKGFEDRKTFHVVGRDWPGGRYLRIERGPRTMISLGECTVSLPSNASSLSDVRVEDSDGKTVFQCGELRNSAWLPPPGSVPDVWAVSDTPRIVPPEWGATPPPQESAFPDTSGWDIENDAPDTYIFLANGDYKQLRADFLRLTGPVEMPPLYAFGLWDSKYYAYTEATALSTIDAFRARRIPLDVFVIDTDWRIGASHGYAPNTEYFPDLQRLFSETRRRNVRVMFNDHPEPQSKSALDPKELKYRSDGLKGLLEQGLDAWWFDRNWSTALLEPAPGLRKEVWGMRLFYDITLSAKPGLRPLIMANVDGIDNGFVNRPPNIAAHRYPVQWTGDTRANWQFLKMAVENAVLSGVVGLNAYVNDDLGGHMGTPTNELYVRYLQFGALCPVMRVHCTKGEMREPWLFGDEAEAIVADYVRLRYRLLPLLYASARSAYEEGEPILRRADLDFPQYKEAASNSQYLIGRHLLIAPIVSSNASSPVPANVLNITGEYFANADLSGEPVSKGPVEQIDFQWGASSPQGLPTNRFSARWTGTIGPIPNGKRYRLSVTADDGVRLWLDGNLVVDKWVPQDSVTTAADVTLEPNSTHTLRMEYFEAAGDALCRLSWSDLDKPVTTERTVWIPPGTWIDLWNGVRITGPRNLTVSAPLSQIPMFVREGAIIPLVEEMQFTGQKPWDPIVLEAFPSRIGGASATVYEDDGATNEYTKNKCRKTIVSVKTDPWRQVVTVQIEQAKGDFAGAGSKRAYVIRLRAPQGWNGQPVTVSIDGKPWERWRALPRSSSRSMPLMASGPALDGDVTEIELPAASVGMARTVEVVYR
jgi:hypothetical protein